MKLVLDASVAVAAVRPRERDHTAARAQVERALQGVDELVEPALFAVEVAGALARLGHAERDVRALLDSFRRPPHRVATLGPRRAEAALACATRARLRGGNAVYVSLAATLRLPLCTLDGEMRDRGAAFCEVLAPAADGRLR